MANEGPSGSFRPDPTGAVHCYDWPQCERVHVFLKTGPAHLTDESLAAMKAMQEFQRRLNTAVDEVVDTLRRADPADVAPAPAPSPTFAHQLVGHYQHRIVVTLADGDTRDGPLSNYLHVATLAWEGERYLAFTAHHPLNGFLSPRTVYRLTPEATDSRSI